MSKPPFPLELETEPRACRMLEKYSSPSPNKGAPMFAYLVLLLLFWLLQTHPTLKKKNYLDFNFICECFVSCKYVYHMYVWFLGRPKNSTRSPKRGRPKNSTRSPKRESARGCWRQNLGLLQEQQVLLATEHLSTPNFVNHFDEPPEGRQRTLPF